MKKKAKIIIEVSLSEEESKNWAKTNELMFACQYCLRDKGRDILLAEAFIEDDLD